MDFISIANTETFMKRNLLRHLQQQQQQQYNPSSNQNNEYESIFALSPTAEGELFMLCTNFLLYVAMVIVGVLVCKIYFPELLERREPLRVAPRSRSFTYRKVDNVKRAPSTQSSSSSIMEMEDEEENESESSNNENDENYYASDGEEEEEGDNEDDEDEVLDSETEEDEEELENDEGIRKDKKSSRNMLTSPIVRSGSGVVSLLDTNIDQESLSKTQVLKRLTFCAIMLNVTFVIWGILQERMLTRKYPRGTGEYFTYSYALVFTNRFWTMLFSGFLMFFYLKPQFSKSTIIYEYSFPSISNMLSSWCQYEALRYVSFPAATLFKAFKLAPVMTMGKILGNKTYPSYDYVVAFLIGVGITMFMSSTENLTLPFTTDIYGDETSALKWTGIMLLFLFLLFDSFTSQWQSRMFQRHRDLSMIELMFATSACSTILSLITLIHTKELYPFIEFIKNHSEIHLHFLLFSLASTIGQLFIFYTIKNFGAVIFTLIMTTRLLVSIAISVVMYGHRITGVGFLGLIMVIGSVLYRIKRKAEGKQLLKWTGMLSYSTKEHDLVHEWHEHGDM